MQPGYPLIFLINLVAEVAPLLVVVGSGRRLRSLAAVTLANALTHPLLWFGLPHIDAPWGTKLAAAEVLVVTVEAAVLWVTLRSTRWTGLRSLATSVFMNTASFALTFVVPF